MPGASFSHPSGSVTFRSGPPRPDASLAVVQPQRKSAAGVRLGYAHTIIDNTLPLKLRATTAEKDQFITFFNTIAQGMAELIGYTDPAGNSISGRFAQPTYSVLEKAFDAWEISCSLRIFDTGWQWPSGNTLLWPSGATMGVQ